jgi:hypothetical protein
VCCSRGDERRVGTLGCRYFQSITGRYSVSMQLRHSRTIHPMCCTGIPSRPRLGSTLEHTPSTWLTCSIHCLSRDNELLVAAMEGCCRDPSACAGINICSDHPRGRDFQLLVPFRTVIPKSLNRHQDVCRFQGRTSRRTAGEDCLC